MEGKTANDFDWVGTDPNQVLELASFVKLTN